MYTVRKIILSISQVKIHVQLPSRNFWTQVKDSRLSDTIWQTDFSFCQKGDIIAIVLLAYSRNFASSFYRMMYCKSIEFQHEKHS